MSKSIEILTNDHKTLLRVANVLDCMSEKVHKKGEFHPEDVETMLRILRLFADDYLQAKEEGALFPAFTKACDLSQYQTVRHMLFEHDQDRSLIEGIEDAFRRSNPYQFAEYSSRLSDLLRTHVYKEENFLFEIIESNLSAADDARVVDEFVEYDRRFQRLHEHNLMHGLHLLEWKYLCKTA